MMPTINTSMPKAFGVWFGTKNRIDITKTFNSNSNESNALSGKPPMESIFVKLIEMPTKINPVRAAEAPATATKKSCHSIIFYSTFTV